jgi:hypothetical protein
MGVKKDFHRVHLLTDGSAAEVKHATIMLLNILAMRLRVIDNTNLQMLIMLISSV